MGGKLIAVLINFAYATMGEPEPKGNDTEEKMVADLKRFADIIRDGEGFATQDDL